MKTFLDNAGRTWPIEIHVAAVKRCRALAGVDLYGLVDGGFDGLARLLGDPVQLVDVLYCLCRDEAQRLGVSDEDFGRAIAGDALERAAEAFLAELTDFFPSPRVREALRKLFDAGGRIRDRVIDRLAERLATLDPAAEADRWIGSSGSSPGPSASTPPG